MGKKFVFTKPGQEKEFTFDPVTQKEGKDTFTLTWERSYQRFDLRKNGTLLFSDVNSTVCANWLKDPTLNNQGLKITLPLKKAAVLQETK